MDKWYVYFSATSNLVDYHKNGISLTSRLILHVHKQILPLFRMILPTIDHQQFGYISVNNQMKHNRYMLCKRFYRVTISLRLVTNAHSLITKGGYFSESAICFFKSLNLQKKITPNHYSELEI